MKKSLLVAALIAVALSACSKKEAAPEPPRPVLTEVAGKRKQARKTDGLPADGGSVETPEQAETPKDMFDEVIERRNKRKF